MKKADVSPPGWSGTTKAMKAHGEIDNPFALAWWMKNQGMHSHKAADDDDKHDDLGAEDFEHLVEPEGGLGGGTPPDVPHPAGVDQPRQTGHTGSAYTYGQRRGVAPDPLDFEPLAVARGEKGYNNMADDRDRCEDDDDVKALHKAMDDDARRVMDDIYDDDDDRHDEPVEGHPSTRGHAMFGGGGAAHANAEHKPGDDDDDDDMFDDAGFDAGMGAHVSEAGHRGTGGAVVGETGHAKHGDDDDDRHADDDDDDDKRDEGHEPPGTDIATSLETMQAQTEEQMIEEYLSVLAQPAPSDPSVSVKTPAGQSRGAIADVPVVGWK